MRIPIIGDVCKKKMPYLGNFCIRGGASHIRDIMNEGFPEQFAALVKAGVKRHGSLEALVAHCGVPRSTLHRWSVSPKQVSLVELARFLSAMGGDIESALPGRRAGGDVARAPISGMRIEGYLTAGSLDWMTNPKELARAEAVPVDPEAWKTSRWWSHTTGDVRLAKIRGDSMAPDYPDGMVIAVRAPSSPPDIPDGAPCVFMDPRGGETFKLLSRSTEGTIVGVPINYRHKAIIMSKGVEISYIVLGGLVIS